MIESYVNIRLRLPGESLKNTLITVLRGVVNYTELPALPHQALKQVE